MRRSKEEYEEMVCANPEDFQTWEQREIAKYKNAPRPGSCPECGAELKSAGGMVGEEVLYCPNGHGVFWEDCEDAISRVI